MSGHLTPYAWVLTTAIVTALALLAAGSGRGLRRHAGWRVADAANASTGNRLGGFRPSTAPHVRVALLAGMTLVLVHPALAAFVLPAALASLAAERAHARRAEVLARRAAVPAAVATVAAALRAGLPVLTAWSLLAPEAGPEARHGTGDALLAPVAAAARLGLDIGVALEDAARRPGAEALAAVAVCCRVTEDAGSGLAGALERLAEGLRDDEELRGIVDAELASARSTGRLLAALPVVGVAGAAALGTPPRQLLLGSPVGRVCAVAAAVLEVAGLLWLRRLAASVG